MLIWILSRFAMKKPKRKLWDLLSTLAILCALGGLFILTSCSGGGRYYNDGYYDGGYYDDGYYYNRGYGHHDGHDGDRDGGGHWHGGQGGGTGSGGGGHAGAGGGGHR